LLDRRWSSTKAAKGRMSGNLGSHGPHHDRRSARLATR
jgi:hypothetical protein